MCWFDAVFKADGGDLLQDLEGGYDLLLLGGGDVSALRSALDWDRVRRWVERGGHLVATCAGAYLLREWLGAGIANVTDAPPEGTPEGAWTRCEGGIVIHPVRGPVSLEPVEGSRFTAPVFGGPVFTEPEGDRPRVEARYAGVTRGAVWLLADRPEMLARTPAVVSGSIGEGRAVLAGPHLEHPDHPDAHAWLAGLLGHGPGEAVYPAPSPRAGSEPAGEEVVRRLATIRARAISISDVSWRSGDKVWDGQRVAGFADAVIPLARGLARWGWAPRGKAGGLLPLLEAAERRMGARADPRAWDSGFAAVSEAATLLMDAYFASRRAGMPAPPRRARPPTRLASGSGHGALPQEPVRAREVRR